MKKSVLIILAVCGVLFANAQAVPNASFTDCNGVTKSIYQTLATGKVLFVANAGTNCSICMSHAGIVGTNADSNLATIEVWGSITTKTGGNPGCGALNNWVTTYGWSNVFTFLDVNKIWFQAATPRYTVIDPSDSSIAYAGSNLTTAMQTAGSLVPNNIGVDELEIVTNISVSPSSINLELTDIAKNGEVKLFDVTGKLLESWSFENENKTIQLPFNKNVKRGIYLLSININGQQFVKKLFL